EQSGGEPAPHEASRAARAGAARPDAARLDQDAIAIADAAAQSDTPGDTAEAPPSAASAAAPHLSLAALGVDGQNPFLERSDPATLRAAKAARMKRRLDKSLAQGLANQDVRSG